ncbi:glycosyltransferase [Algoriphagus sp.]|uniref:glycosyltransferase n=1 Tax=Algoriphagus sp. TaxID=1872435 RepID=UPI0032851987
MITWIALGVIFLILCQFVLAVIWVEFYWKNHSNSLPASYPNVSVLVAARNEEKDLPELLSAFDRLEYPPEKLQFLFADDQSSDSTARILEEWCAKATNRSFVTIAESDTGKYNENGKANALAILEEMATGTYYFFTDADCVVSTTWIQEGVRCFGEKVGIVLGITHVKASDLLAEFQKIDWWFTLGFVKVATDLGIPTTGLGNNMVISQEAYRKSGGFKNLPFCLTEDLEISRAIQREGFVIAHQVSKEMLALTKSETSYSNLLTQRKRWMSGVMTLPLYWKVVLALQVIYFGALFLVIYINPLVGLGLAFSKVLAQSIFLARVVRKAGERISWIKLLLFDFYNFNTTLLTILYYFWPAKTKWKSRAYS